MLEEYLVNCYKANSRNTGYDGQNKMLDQQGQWLNLFPRCTLVLADVQNLAPIFIEDNFYSFWRNIDNRRIHATENTYYMREEKPSIILQKVDIEK